MRLHSKRALANKLNNFPLLRQLLFERWFRVAFGGLVLVFVFFALFLPKIWRTSPSGFLPVIRVSGLDLVQAWALQRTATKAAAAGNFDEASYAWQAALANNRADPRLVRGALRNVLLDPRKPRHGGIALRECFWLLKLTGTNIADLELTAKVLEQLRYYDQAAAWIEPNRKALTPGLRAVYMKALFNQGRMDAFAAQWDASPDPGQHDPELPLYRAAYDVGWGPPGKISQGRQQLEAALRDPSLRVLSLQLQLALNRHEINSSDYGQTLSKLEELREDALNHHTGYWRLLAATGRKEEALKLARTYPHPPGTPLELVELAQSHWELGMHEQSLQMLGRYAGEFGHAAVFWVTYAQQLLESKRWDDLRALALKIRGEEGVRDQLGAFSYFLEGRAEQALGRSANALAAFEKAAEREFPYAGLGLRVAAQLLQLGHPALAGDVLARLEKALETETAYWILVFQVADQLKDVDLLLRAGTSAYALKPNDPIVMNNYAAALIITRQSPQDAIRVTLPLFSDNPNSLHAVVNHSAALLLNGRPEEAHALLQRVSPGALTAAQRALYNLDLFETYVSLRDYDQARAVSELIEARHLYPCQREWLEAQRQQLPPEP